MKLIYIISTIAQLARVVCAQSSNVSTNTLDNLNALSILSAANATFHTHWTTITPPAKKTIKKTVTSRVTEWQALPPSTVTIYSTLRPKKTNPALHKRIDEALAGNSTTLDASSANSWIFTASAAPETQTTDSDYPTGPVSFGVSTTASPLNQPTLTHVTGGWTATSSTKHSKPTRVVGTSDMTSSSEYVASTQVIGASITTSPVMDYTLTRTLTKDSIITDTVTEKTTITKQSTCTTTVYSITSGTAQPINTTTAASISSIDVPDVPATFSSSSTTTTTSTDGIVDPEVSNAASDTPAVPLTSAGPAFGTTATTEDDVNAASSLTSPVCYPTIYVTITASSSALIQPTGTNTETRANEPHIEEPPQQPIDQVSASTPIPATTSTINRNTYTHPGAYTSYGNKTTSTSCTETTSHTLVASDSANELANIPPPPTSMGLDTMWGCCEGTVTTPANSQHPASTTVPQQVHAETIDSSLTSPVVHTARPINNSTHHIHHTGDVSRAAAVCTTTFHHEPTKACTATHYATTTTLEVACKGCVYESATLKSAHEKNIVCPSIVTLSVAASTKSVCGYPESTHGGSLTANAATASSGFVTHASAATRGGYGSQSGNWAGATGYGVNYAGD